MHNPNEAFLGIENRLRLLLHKMSTDSEMRADAFGILVHFHERIYLGIKFELSILSLMQSI